MAKYAYTEYDIKKAINDRVSEALSKFRIRGCLSHFYGYKKITYTDTFISDFIYTYKFFKKDYSLSKHMLYPKTLSLKYLVKHNVGLFKLGLSYRATLDRSLMWLENTEYKVRDFDDIAKDISYDFINNRSASKILADYNK